MAPAVRAGCRPVRPSHRLPELAIECAGHGAVAEYGESVSDERLGFPRDVRRRAHRRPSAAPARAREPDAHGKVLIPAGALAGIDALAAARLGGLERVRYTSRKLPLAWVGTPAEKLCDLGCSRESTEFYAGNAGDAARLFPQNANVAATIALAGLGFDRTEVSLNADPRRAGQRPRHRGRGRLRQAPRGDREQASRREPQDLDARGAVGAARDPEPDRGDPDLTLN